MYKVSYLVVSYSLISLKGEGVRVKEKCLMKEWLLYVYQRILFKRFLSRNGIHSVSWWKSQYEKTSCELWRKERKSNGEKVEKREFQSIPQLINHNFATILCGWFWPSCAIFHWKCQNITALRSMRIFCALCTKPIRMCYCFTVMIVTHIMSICFYFKYPHFAQSRSYHKQTLVRSKRRELSFKTSISFFIVVSIM